MLDVYLRVPMAWDCEYWSLQTDAALLARLVGGLPSGRTIQLQMIVFYLSDAARGISPIPSRLRAAESGRVPEHAP